MIFQSQLTIYSGGQHGRGQTAPSGLVHPVVCLMRRRHMNISSSLNGSLQTRFFSFFLFKLSCISCIGQDQPCHAGGVCRHFLRSLNSKSEQTLATFEAFLSSDTLFGFCCRAASFLASCADYPTPPQTHPQNVTCMLVHFHAQICIRQTRVYVTFPVVAVHPRP